MSKQTDFLSKRSAIVIGAAIALALPILSSGVRAEGPPAGDFGRGVKAWADNCARCHNMRDPKEFRDDQWRVIVNHMRVRGGLTGQDTRDILAYLRKAN